MVLKKIKVLAGIFVVLFMTSLSAFSAENDLFEALGRRESGIHRACQEQYEVRNRLDFIGKYQVGEILLNDLGYFVSYDGDHYYYGSPTKNMNTWQGTWHKGLRSLNHLIGNKDIQEEIIRAAFKKNERTIKRGLDINSLTELGRDYGYTKGGILAGAHLCGSQSVINFFNSGGEIRAQDENGTRLTTYMEEFSAYRYRN